MFDSFVCLVIASLAGFVPRVILQVFVSLCWFFHGVYSEPEAHVCARILIHLYIHIYRERERDYACARRGAADARERRARARTRLRVGVCVCVETGICILERLHRKIYMSSRGRMDSLLGISQRRPKQCSRETYLFARTWGPGWPAGEASFQFHLHLFSCCVIP